MSAASQTKVKYIYVVLMVCRLEVRNVRRYLQRKFIKLVAAKVDLLNWRQR